MTCWIFLLSILLLIILILLTRVFFLKQFKVKIYGKTLQRRFDRASALSSWV